MTAAPTASAMSDSLARFARHRLARVGAYGVGVALAVLAVVAGTVGFALVVGATLDRADLLRLDAETHRWLFEAFGASATLGRVVTWFGNHDTLVAGVVGVALALLIARRPWAAFRVVFASGVGGPVSVGLKALFERARPLEQVIPATGYSFPSGHAFASTVFYGVLLYVVWRLTERRAVRVAAAVVLPAIILAVGASRVYLNVHYPTDVIAGWLAGAAWLGASLLIVETVETRTRSWRERREERTRAPDATPD